MIKIQFIEMKNYFCKYNLWTVRNLFHCLNKYERLEYVNSTMKHAGSEVKINLKSVFVPS